MTAQQTYSATSVLRIAALAGLAIASILLLRYYGVKDIQENIQRLGIYAPLVFVVVCILKPLLFVLPSMGLTVIAGVIFGPVYGTILVVLGGAGSSIVGFYFARWVGKHFIEKRIGHRRGFLSIEKWMQSQGGKTILTMRLLNLPWDMVSYWAGFTGVPFKDFYIASLIPLIPVSFLYTYFGSTLFDPTSYGFIISLLLIVFLGATPYLLRKWKKQK